MFSFETPPRRDFFLIVRKLAFQQFSVSEEMTHPRFLISPRTLAMSAAESKQADGRDRWDCLYSL